MNRGAESNGNRGFESFRQTANATSSTAYSGRQGAPQSGQTSQGWQRFASQGGARGAHPGTLQLGLERVHSSSVPGRARSSSVPRHDRPLRAILSRAGNASVHSRGPTAPFRVQAARSRTQATGPLRAPVTTPDKRGRVRDITLDDRGIMVQPSAVAGEPAHVLPAVVAQLRRRIWASLRWV
jgi:hypothetical protein